MLRRINYIIIILFFLTWEIKSQTTFYINGAPDPRPGLVAFTNTNIFTDYQTLLKNATLIIENGKVKQAGIKIPVPAHAKVIDLKGKYIYPSFVDLHTQYGIEPNKYTSSSGPQYEPAKKGAFPWNDAIKSYQEAHTIFKNDNVSAAAFRKAGFGAVLTFQQDGIARGTSSLVLLSGNRENENILLEKAATHFAFNRGTSNQVYPGSLMGIIALLRQTFYDANWYAALKDANEKHIGLEALIGTQRLPKIIEVYDKQSILRADKIGDEFGCQFIIKGTGHEYQLMEQIKKSNAPLIVPVNFPKAIDVTDPLDLDVVPLNQMKHWELAPFNLSYLEKANIPFAITSEGKDLDKFLNNLKKAVRSGLSHKQALKALTFMPAKLVNAEKVVGSLKQGFAANFIISSDSIFKESGVILENWVNGIPYIIKNAIEDKRGIYDLYIRSEKKNIFPDSMILSITGKEDSPEFEISKDSLKSKASFESSGKTFVITFDWKKTPVRLTGWMFDNTISGTGLYNDKEKISWTAISDFPYKEPPVSDSVKKAEYKQRLKEDSIIKKTGEIMYPFQPYGFASLPTAKTVLIKNVTLWTNEKEGIIKNGYIVLSQGKILKIGKGEYSIKTDTVIDGTGKHLTPGIIDEHSHIAISGGVNECSYSNTAEVRIGDILDAEDINIYRNLSGGVTAAQILHGSCNPIGGQSGIIKLRWGKTGEELKIKGADEFIKFALGENVKQANWGDIYTERFPQTRMGVEQVYIDAFTRARAYEAEWDAYNKNKKLPRPRRNLQLEALVEILNRKRFITCHSYVQSEIVMLMRVAESYNFRVNTFTHILEGYKVADKMKEHGAGASTFSDWWAYKLEVKDAIPYNAAIMYKMGIVTAINSDNPEMARRLNQEAAKAVKYGNIAEEDALKMVTLNPAKLLHLDKITGSLKEGKDADIVLWSDHPLSVYAKAEQTYVDGICLFDINRDKQLKLQIEAEKLRIIQKMMEAKKKGEPVQKPAPDYVIIWDCEGERKIKQN